MLKHIKVKNLKGFNYVINFNSGSRSSNIIELPKRVNLFATFHITGEQVYKALDVFNVLIIIRNPETFKTFCISYVHEEVFIEISFVQLDPERAIYVENTYSILFDENGVIEESCNGRVLAKNLLGKFYPEIPEHVFMYLRSIFYFNFADPMSMSSLRTLFIASTKMAAFLKFFNTFMFDIMKFEKVEVVASQSDIVVFNKAGVSTNFDVLDSDFRTLCYISWALHVNFLKTGVLILNNIDKALSEEKLNKVLQMFNDPNCISMNPAQLIFSTTWTQSPNLGLELYPEQTMFVQKIDAKYFVCSTTSF